MHIAICDDDDMIVAELEQIITAYTKENAIDVVCHCFCAGEELWQDLQAGHQYQLIILDIQMQQLDGLTLGRNIRQQLDDKLTPIIYISTEKSYAYDLYDVYPLTFFVKPLNSMKIKDALGMAFQRVKSNQALFWYSSKGESKSVKLEDILYFESKAKMIKIVLEDEIMTYKGKLVEVIENLSDQDFLAIHKSILVNTWHIKSYLSESVILHNGQSLPISQSHRKAVRSYLLKQKGK